MSSTTWSKMAPMLDVLMQNYRKCITFIAIVEYNNSYKIGQCYASLYKHIIFMEQLNGKDNKVYFEILVVKLIRY